MASSIVRQRTCVPLDAFSASTQSQSNRRRLRFGDTVQVLYIPNREDYDEKEAQQIWYSGPDILNMKPSTRDVKKLYKTGCGEDCMRGLECRTEKGGRRRTNNFLNAGLAVVQEQQFQRSMGLNNPEALAGVYSNATRKCRKEAHIKALIDARYAMECVYGVPWTLKSRNPQKQEKAWAFLNKCTCHEVDIVHKVHKQLKRGCSGSSETEDWHTIVHNMVTCKPEISQSVTVEDFRLPNITCNPQMSRAVEDDFNLHNITCNPQMNRRVAVDDFSAVF